MLNGPDSRVSTNINKVDRTLIREFPVESCRRFLIEARPRLTTAAGVSCPLTAAANWPKDARLSRLLVPQVQQMVTHPPTANALVINGLVIKIWQQRSRKSTKEEKLLPKILQEGKKEGSVFCSLGYWLAGAR